MRIIKESTTSRIYQHLTDDSNCAIISAYRYDYDDNKHRHKLLASDIRELGLGYIEFESRWSFTDEKTGEIEHTTERSYMIPNIDYEDAVNLGIGYEQDSIIFKDKDSCREVCTNEFTDWEGVKHSRGDVIQIFGTKMNYDDAQNIFYGRKEGPASMPIKGSNKKPFRLETLEVVPQKASMFVTEERFKQLFTKD